jgi:hypothetical protein
MKNNIMPFRSPVESTRDPVRPLRIESVAGFGLIDCLMFAWLFTWAPVAGFEWVLAARFIAA